MTGPQESGREGKGRRDSPRGLGRCESSRPVEERPATVCVPFTYSPVRWVGLSFHRWGHGRAARSHPLESGSFSVFVEAKYLTFFGLAKSLLILTLRDIKKKKKQKHPTKTSHPFSNTGFSCPLTDRTGWG